MLEGLLRYAPEPTDKAASQRPSAPGLEDFLEDKVEGLGSILNDIKKETTNRETLSKNVISLIYQHYLYVKSKLHELYHIAVGHSRAIEGRRTALERQLDTFKEEARKERILCWQDIAALNKELRAWLKQYLDIEQRVRLILPKKNKNR